MPASMNKKAAAMGATTNSMRITRFHAPMEVPLACLLLLVIAQPLKVHEAPEGE
jgi:hypothetical protein